jgi:peroxiredoxin
MQTEIAASPPAVGEVAPDFTLPSTSGEPITLSSYRGDRPVLIAFFPLAFSGTCTKEFCEITEEFPRFEPSRVVVMPISVDSKYALKEYKQKHAMPFDLLSDFHSEVSSRYCVFLEDRGYANRAYFLVDRDGIIRWEHVEDVPSHKRDNEELLRHIAEVA